MVVECHAMHTAFQPSDNEWMCPVCGDTEEFSLVRNAEGCGERCDLLHLEDEIYCIKCDATWSGEEIASLFYHNLDNVPCPLCRGQGKVTGQERLDYLRLKTDNQRQVQESVIWSDSKTTFQGTSNVTYTDPSAAPMNITDGSISWTLPASNSAGNSTTTWVDSNGDMWTTSSQNVTAVNQPMLPVLDLDNPAHKDLVDKAVMRLSTR